MKKFWQKGIIKGMMALLLVIALSLEMVSFHVAAEDNPLTITDVTVAGDQVTITCSGYEAYETSWVAVFTKESWESNPKGEYAYEYCKNMPDGKKTFPLSAGDYYAALYQNDDWGSFVCAKSFTIGQAETEAAYYVSASGSDENNGESVENAFATLQKAVAALNSVTVDRKVIKVAGTVNYTDATDEGLGVHSGNIIICGADENAELYIDRNFYPKGSVTFEQLKISYPVNGFTFICERNMVRFGKGVTMGNPDVLPTLITGNYGAWSSEQNVNPVRESITIDSGGLADVWLGSSATNKKGLEYSVVNGADLTLNNGGWITKIYLGAGGGWDNFRAGNHYIDDINIVINGGILYKGITWYQSDGIDPSTLNGHALQIIFNNGMAVTDSTDMVTAKEIEDAGGVFYRLDCAAGGYLETTETAGTYRVKGGMSAIAVNSDTKEETPSADGVLTVAPGTYTVSFQAPSKVYVNAESGDDTADGSAPDTALKTIGEAVNRLCAAEEQPKTIVICGTVELGTNDAAETLPAHSDMIVIKGDGSGESLLKMNHNVTINGPLTLENMKIAMKAPETYMNTIGQKLVLGDGLTIAAYPAFNGHVGTLGTDGGHEDITINSGSYGNFFVGASFNGNNTVHQTAGADMVVNGGSISNIYVCADGLLMENYKGNQFTENVNITFNGGSFGRIATGFEEKKENDTVFEKAFQIILNNGVNGSVPAVGDVSAAGGYWVMKGAEGGALAATKDAGVYTVIDGKTAVAMSEDGSEYYVSNDGTLTVKTPGIYKVTYADKVDYVNTGKKIDFLADCEANLSVMEHVEQPGKLFVGWADKNGSGVTSASFTAGTQLKASYIDFNADEDFFVSGTQIKKVAGEEKEALRFRTSVSEQLLDDLSKTGDVSYGTVWLQSRYLGYSDLELGGKYSYESKEYEAKAVSQELQTTKDGYRLYVATEKELGEEAYSEAYTAKGYIVYHDINGNVRVLHTDGKTASVYSTAKKLMELPDLTAEEKQYFEKIITAVEETAKEQCWNQEKTEILDGFYQLANGLVVREAEFDSGKGGDPVEIVQASDFHFNFCNSKDFAENNPSTMSTWQQRDMNKKNLSVLQTISKCMEYGGFADQIVVTGDAIDYLSYGNLDMLQRYVWDIYPDTLVTLGNHDPVRVMGLPNDVPDPTSLDSRYQILQEHWKHNVYYTSRVLKDKVMIIQLDNSQNKFWDCQIEPLKKDLAEAKEKGYTVLVFMHCAVSTGNEADVHKAAIRIQDPSGSDWDFYNTIGNMSDDGNATKQVYELLTNNAEVVKGFFTGHMHSDFYMDVKAKTSEGKETVIPQYVLTQSSYEDGTVLKITVK